LIAAPARDLAALRRRLREGSDRFLAEHGAEVEAWRKEISVGVLDALASFRRDVEELSGANPLACEVVRQASEYVDWLQWTLWDLPVYAVALRPEPERFRRAVSACGLVYISVRVLDDLLDRHFWYRGRRHSLLATLTRSHGRGRRSEGLTMLAALLLCFEGLARLTSSLDDVDLRGTLEATVAATRRVLIGLIVEESEREAWSPAMYERLVELKNVDYFRSLYAALDPAKASPLVPFLDGYAALAQRLNDLQDHPADEARNQPNLVSVYRPRPRGAVAVSQEEGAGPDRIEEILAADFERLAGLIEELPPLERSIASLKLGEHLEEALALGLFGGGRSEDRPEQTTPPPSPSPTLPAPKLGLTWYANSSDVLERLGPSALEEVDCPVCGGSGRKWLLDAQGFPLVRCLDCFHVYVRPRVTQEVQSRISAEDEEPQGDTFLDVQKLYAEPLCRRLRQDSAGLRLLDVGFGKGYLMHVARAYGFEVYGVDGSDRLVERQRPYFGERLARMWIGAEPFPWGSFDVAVLSHVVEHLPDPRETLRRVHEALNPGGLIYVAVPDLGSMQFRVLGRRWNAIQPLVHLQYFNQASLTRLFEDAGFEVVERIEHPPFTDRVATRWMRLFRRLGGSESGELALLGRKPLE
jgi:2-polyprenyl-3-methyl-5-hydroxy-6-metoxy-1,4-benzoquinol methylase